MKTIEIRVEDNVWECGEEIAAEHGVDLENMVKAYLEHLATNKGVEDDAREFARLAREKGGRSSDGYTFNREEIHRRGRQ